MSFKVIDRIPCVDSECKETRRIKGHCLKCKRDLSKLPRLIPSLEVHILEYEHIRKRREKRASWEWNAREDRCIV